MHEFLLPNCAAAFGFLGHRFGQELILDERFVVGVLARRRHKALVAEPGHFFKTKRGPVAVLDNERAGGVRVTDGFELLGIDRRHLDGMSEWIHNLYSLDLLVRCYRPGLRLCPDSFSWQHLRNLRKDPDPKIQDPALAEVSRRFKAQLTV